MVTTARAALSVVLLLGFYVYAFGVVVAFGALTVLLANYVQGAVIGKLAIVTLLMAGGICYATWKVIRTRPSPMPGLVLPEHRAPDLWREVRAIAGAVATRPPDEIRLVAEANAAVSEDARLLGLVGGRRYLYVGVPLLQGVTLQQLRFVLAHELGHYSHQHTRLGELTYRGRVVIVRTIAQVGPSSLGGLLLRAYAALYQMVSAAVSRAQEIEADRVAARVAGTPAATSALRELPGLSAAWEFYLDNYVGWGLDSGYAPVGVLAHFPDLLAGRANELAAIRAKGAPDQRSRWDSHPPIAERVALLEREPAGPVGDDRPATVFVGDLDGAIAELDAKLFGFGGRTRVPYPTYTAAAMQWQLQRHADALYRAAARLPGSAGANLGSVLGLLGAGRLDELRRAVLTAAQLADPATADAQLRSYLRAAFATAAVSAGVAQWRHSWSEEARLVDAVGAPVDLDPQAAAAIAGRVADVHQWLAAWGVDLAVAAARETTATATGAGTVAGIVNLKVDGKRRDLVILTAGLVVVPGMPRLKMRRAKRRMYELLTQAPPAQMASAPGHRFIPYEEVASGRMVRRAPAMYELGLHSGERLRIRWGAESEEVGPGWQSLRQAVEQLTPAA